ncbi:MAG: hypothetical protein ACTS53_00820 [Candidatus Hodgkinia cicadicola]
MTFGINGIRILQTQNHHSTPFKANEGLNFTISKVLKCKLRRRGTNHTLIELLTFSNSSIKHRDLYVTRWIISI